MPFNFSGGKGGGGRRLTKRSRRKVKRGGRKGVSKVNRSGKMKNARKRRGFEGNSMAGL